MKVSKSLCALVLAMAVSACGGKENKSKDEKGKLQLELLKDGEFSLQLDGSNMPANLVGASIVWNAQVYLKKSSEKILGQDFSDSSFERLAKQVAEVKIKSGETAVISINSMIVSGEDYELLLTNDKEDAYKQAKTKAAWDKNCGQISAPTFTFDADGLRGGKFEILDAKSVLVKLPVCNFMPEDVPVKKVDPIAGVKLHNVTFRCEADNDSSLYLFEAEKPVCRYGYRSEDGTSIANEVPVGTDLTKEFRPEINFSFSNELGRDQFKLYAYWNDMSQLPKFATKDRGCNKIEFVQYELANPSKEYRFKFEDKGNGWVSLTELGKRPGISHPSKIEYFLHCFWRGSADESTASVLN